MIANRPAASLLFAVLTALAPLQSEANPYLVKDLTTGSDDPGVQVVGQSNGFVFFVTGSPSGYSRVLWRTDGTIAGTIELAVVAPPYNYDPRSISFLDLEGTAYFVSSLFGHPEIWKSDGTAAGTVRVAASSASSIIDLTNVGGVLFFASAPSGSNSYDLWKSDGTEAGTEMIADIDYGSSMSDVDGVAWFKGTDAGGWEAWRSDGTEAGTYRVADINPGASHSHASGFASIGGLACFGAINPATGYELHTSDGTEAGTELVVDLDGTSSSSIVGAIQAIGGRMYFSAYGPGGLQLYESDCTAAGTVPIAPLEGGVSLVEANGLLFFEARTAATGPELWKSDGTPAGTSLVRDIRPGTVGSAPGGFVALGGLTYFSADDGVAGRELWRTNGTSAGTTRVADIWPGVAPADPGPLLVAGGKLVFTASEGEHRELWVSDGTQAGTSILVDLGSGPSDSSGPTELVASGGRVAFRATDNDGSGMWISAGTFASTKKFTDIQASSFADWNGTFIVMGDPFANPGMWLRAPDGTLTKIANEPAHRFKPVGDSLFFARANKAFVTDGTPFGEVQLASFAGSSCTGRFCPPTGQLTFGFVDIGSTVLIAVIGLSTADAHEIWKTDGTAAGTTKVGEVQFSSLLDFDHAVVGGKLFFASGDAEHGVELWSSDGTSVAPLVDIEPGTGSSYPSEFVVAGGRLYFAAQTSAGGRELWSTDGTAMGTMQVADIEAGAAGGFPQELTAFDDLVVFTAEDASGGREIWTSDGTLMGTTRVADIMVGPVGSAPMELTRLGGRIYFRADDGITGDELWRTDGTEAGTELVADINTGGAWSWPTRLTPAGGRLFFAATTFTNGTELWALDVALDCGNGSIDPGETCDDGNQEPFDGCNDECVTESCGDGVLDDGELCDDGNHVSLDGCSRTCVLDCPLTTPDGCRLPNEPGGSRVSVKVDDDPAKARLTWSWSRGDAAKEDFGDPTDTTSFALCIYDDSSLVFEANAAGGSTCGSRACWSEKSSGFSFKQKTAYGGLQIKLDGHPDPGRGKLGVKMRGDTVALSDVSQLFEGLSVRMHNGLACWGADYSPPFRKQSETGLQAESD